MAPSCAAKLPPPRSTPAASSSTSSISTMTTTMSLLATGPAIPCAAILPMSPAPPQPPASSVPALSSVCATLSSATFPTPTSPSLSTLSRTSASIISPPMTLPSASGTMPSDCIPPMLIMLMTNAIDCKCNRCEVEKNPESSAHLLKHERELATSAKDIMDKVERNDKPLRPEVPQDKLPLVRASVAEHYLALAFGLREVEGHIAAGLTAWLTRTAMDALESTSPGSQAHLRGIALARISLDISDVSMSREMQALVCRYGKEVDIHSLERSHLSIDAQARCMGLRGHAAEAFVCHGIPLISYDGMNAYQEAPRMYASPQMSNSVGNVSS